MTLFLALTWNPRKGKYHDLWAFRTSYTFKKASRIFTFSLFDSTNARRSETSRAVIREESDFSRNLHSATSALIKY